MDFIAGGLVELLGGLASAAVLFGFAWWAPLVLGRRPGSPPTGCCGRAASGATATPTRCARPSATPTTPTGWRSTRRRPRSCACSGWPTGSLDRFVARRTRLHRAAVRGDPAARAVGAVEPACSCCAANALVFWALAARRARRPARPRRAGRLRPGRASAASLIAFGGLNWALDGAAAPVAAVLRLEPAMAPGRRAARRATAPAGGPAGAGDPLPRRHASPTRGADAPVLDGFDLTIPAGTSLAIVGQNGAGKTTLAKLLCRLYDPQSGAIEVDGVDLRELDLDALAVAGSPRCSRTSSGSSCRCATTSRPRGAPDDDGPGRAAPTAGAADLADARHRAGQGLPGRHRPVRRAVAAGRAGPGAVRGAARAPASCCSTSRPPSSTCAARRRSSSGSWPRPGTAPRS